MGNHARTDKDVEVINRFLYRSSYKQRTYEKPPNLMVAWVVWPVKRSSKTLGDGRGWLFTANCGTMARSEEARVRSLDSKY
jgi:hypothetical protein